MSEYIEYTVNKGDSVKSIAFDHGHFWKTLWDDGKNADLKNKRKDPNVLLADDVIYIPPLRKKEESRASGAKYTFVLKGTPIEIRFVLLKDDKPLKNVKYRATIDGKDFEGQTDPNGKITLSIPPNADSGELRVGEPPHVAIYPIKIGGLDPATDVGGIQQRLGSLGYSTEGDDPGTVGANTGLALTKFQNDNKLDPTGQIDDATRDKLKKVFGC